MGQRITAEAVPYSSVVGRGIELRDSYGHPIALLKLHDLRTHPADSSEDLCTLVASAINQGQSQEDTPDDA